MGFFKPGRKRDSADGREGLHTHRTSSVAVRNGMTRLDFRGGRRREGAGMEDGTAPRAFELDGEGTEVPRR